MKTFLTWASFLWCWLPGTLLHSQYLQEASLEKLILADSQEVSVLAARECRECYYYLPVNFRYSFDKNQTPEISYVSWKNDEGTKTVGGILHFLTVWGLSAQQEEELQQQLIGRVDSNGVIMGAAVVESLSPQSKIQLIGEDEWTGMFQEALTSQSLVATTPGGKMAMSFRFREEAAPRIEKLLERPEKIKTLLQLELKYQVIEAGTGIPIYRQLRLQLPLTYLFKMIRKKE